MERGPKSEKKRRDREMVIIFFQIKLSTLNVCGSQVILSPSPHETMGAKVNNYFANGKVRQGGVAANIREKRVEIARWSSIFFKAS